MNNPLTAPVQIITFPPLMAVWFTPQGFPEIETCADLIAQDGDFYLIYSGYSFTIICTPEVKCKVSAYVVEREEARDVEAAEYDQREAFGIQ